MEKLQEEIRNSHYIYTMDVAVELERVLITTKQQDIWVFFAFVLKFVLQQKEVERKYCCIHVYMQMNRTLGQQERDFMMHQGLFIKDIKHKIIRQVSLINGFIFLLFLMFAFIYMEEIFELSFIFIICLLTSVNTFMMVQHSFKRTMNEMQMQLYKKLEDQQLLDYIRINENKVE